ncbi:hypothetical protein [Halobellus rufus]|uniref:hypothetical protein n=1 Tax=Halobellus rufus TaxID=1448860 RepID=UPI001E407899|nr:hypothetical protein [Halobellus rufus]
MYKAFKLVRSIIVNVGIIILTGYALYLGADPTVIGATSLLVLGGYNGLELGDYLALLQAYKELQREQSSDTDSGD